MGQSCASCGSANADGVRYCAQCGTSLKAQRPSVTDTRRRWVMPAAAVAILLILGGLYFWLFVLDDMQSGSVTPSAEQTKSATAQAQIFFTMTEANIRDKPTTAESVILGKLPRGSQVTGVVQPASVPGNVWVELSDGNGFVAMVNLSASKPPELVTLLKDQLWVVDAPVDVWATAAPDSTLIDRVRAGATLKLVGLTVDNFLEVKLPDGGYGYLADGKSILARLGGKPIGIGFNPPGRPSRAYCARNLATSPSCPSSKFPKPKRWMSLPSSAAPVACLHQHCPMQIKKLENPMLNEARNAYVSPQIANPARLVEAHSALVRRIAWHVHSRMSSAIEVEDLIQIGLIALVEAAQNFEDRGIAFSPYASTRIRGAMVDALRRDARMGRAGMANRRYLAGIRARLEQEYMRSPSDAEMAGATGLDGSNGSSEY